MEVSQTIQCPFCGQSYELLIDTSIESQKLVTDCEVCCRPCEVHVEAELGEVLSVWVEGA
jgi:transcription elongation factor Elf1